MWLMLRLCTPTHALPYTPAILLVGIDLPLQDLTIMAEMPSSVPTVQILINC